MEGMIMENLEHQCSDNNYLLGILELKLDIRKMNF